MSKYSEFAVILRNSIPGLSLREDEPMKQHTTFRVGGSADIFVDCKETDIPEVIRLCDLEKVPLTVLGNGSNILVGDRGIRGCVISIGKNMSKIETNGEVIEAGAGAFLSTVSSRAAADSLAGMEFASGIPGSVGGALFMNAGAYDGSMADIVTSAECIRVDTGEVISMDVDKMDLSYRHSLFQNGEYIITSVKMRLSEGDREAIHEKIEDFTHRRKEKQPIEYPSAGSTFKRPEGRFAGKMIMDAGLCGVKIGGAMVSQKHAGFIINEGDATAGDVRALMEYVQKIVQEKEGILLEPEVRFVGEF